MADYLIEEGSYGIKTITHKVCGKTSYNQNDVKNLFCGFCKIFIEEPLKLQDPKKVRAFVDIFYDTEFIEHDNQIILISIGMVKSTGEEFYAVNKNFPAEKANQWTRENVIPKLEPTKENLKTLRQIAVEVLAFVGQKPPRYWAYGASYDHVLLMKILKDFAMIPQAWPYVTFDLAYEAYRLGNPKLPDTNEKIHNALHDARWAKLVFYWLKAIERGQK